MGISSSLEVVALRLIRMYRVKFILLDIFRFNRSPSEQSTPEESHQMHVSNLSVLSAHGACTDLKRRLRADESLLCDDSIHVQKELWKSLRKIFQEPVWQRPH